MRCQVVRAPPPPCGPRGPREEALAPGRPPHRSHLVSQGGGCRSPPRSPRDTLSRPVRPCLGAVTPAHPGRLHSALSPSGVKWLGTEAGGHPYPQARGRDSHSPSLGATDPTPEPAPEPPAGSSAWPPGSLARRFPSPGLRLPLAAGGPRPLPSGPAHRPWAGSPQAPPGGARGRPVLPSAPPPAPARADPAPRAFPRDAACGSPWRFPLMTTDDDTGSKPRATHSTLIFRGWDPLSSP